jgi:subtilisin family serine protease
MRRFWNYASTLLLFGLMITGAPAAAPAQAARSRAASERSRGVIILPGDRAASLANLRAGDTPVLAGRRVKVEMTDPDVGLLVSSAALRDADLARELAGAGLAAEVNHPRHILPITPTAELFNNPQATRPADLPNSPDFWHVSRIGADIVHQAGITGTATLIVGVVDTGVYTSHPLLAKAILPGFDFVNGDPNANDDVGHGTHVAGIVHSVCPGCSILPVKVLDYYGGDDYTIARGIRYARQRGARIIQISLGGPAPSTTMCQAIKAVEDQGAQVVIAAGNSAGKDDWAIGYPALCSSAALVVSATDRTDIPAWFSNYGPAIDIAAPGIAVWSTVPFDLSPVGLLAARGPSWAAPQVSGAAGLLWSAHPSWTAGQIRARRVATARDIGGMSGIDDGYGPRVDVAQAFGLRARPVVVGMSSDKPWVPRLGSDQERTIQARARVRGDALSDVRLEVTINGSTQQLPMTSQGADTYGLSYTIPKNTAYQRDILLRVTARNSAGSTSGYEEIVVQDGDPIPPATIRIVNGPPRTGRPVEFAVDWAGTWNNYVFNCGNYPYVEILIYSARGRTVTCTYTWPGTFFATAGLYYQDTGKTFTETLVEVQYNTIYLPVVRGKG